MNHRSSSSSWPPPVDDWQSSSKTYPIIHKEYENQLLEYKNYKQEWTMGEQWVDQGRYMTTTVSTCPLIWSW